MLLDLLDAIASEFSLSNPCLVADFRSWGDTIRWRVSTSNTSDFFIKEKVFYLDPQEFSLHLELHQYLLDKGGPVTGIRKTNSGKLWFEIQGRYFEAQAWADGLSLDSSRPEQCSALGNALALFQQKAMGFVDHNFAGWQSPNARSRWFPDRCDILINYADQYLGKRIERASPNTYSLYLQIRAEIESRVNNKAWNSLNCQFLHGDPSPENCLWKSDTQTPLWIDLDDARWGFRIWDLARCAVELAAIKPRKPHEVAILRSDWDLETLSLLLDGFESVLPLDNCEKVMLPECLVLASVAVIIALLDLDETELQTPDEITCICRSLLHLINTIPAIESFRKI